MLETWNIWYLFDERSGSFFFFGLGSSYYILSITYYILHTGCYICHTAKCEASFSCYYYFFCVWSVILHSATLSSRDKYVIFFTSVSQRKNGCKYNFRVFSAVFIRFTKLSLDRKTLYLHILFFWHFGSLNVRKEERIIQFELPCHKTALFYLFLYICELRQILLKKWGQRTLITVVLWCHFHF